MQDLHIRPRDDLEMRARSGDARSFGTYIRLHDHDLRGVVWSVVRSSHATDDVMQVAYEKAFRAIHGFDGHSSLKTWLHSICYRAAIDHVRYEGRRRHKDIDEGERDLRIVPDAADQALARIELDLAFKGLDSDERALLMLTHGLGYSYDDVAEIVDQPRGTVASRVSRARKRLASTSNNQSGEDQL